MRRRTPPAVELGREAHQRDQDRQQHHQRHRQPVDGGGHPERHVALQERRARAVDAARLLGERELGVARHREGAGALEQPDVPAGVDRRRAVHLLHGLRQQAHQRAVRVLAHQHRGRGGEKDGVGRRQVGGEVHHALAQDEPREKREALDVGLGVGEAHEPDVRHPQQALDGAGLGRQHQEAGVGLAVGQEVHVVRQLAVDERGGLGGDAVGRQQAQGEAAGAAPRGSDQDALALEVGEPLDRDAGAVEHPQRLEGDAADGHGARRIPGRGEPALHEGGVHAGGRVRQRLQVGEGAGRLAHLELHAVALEERPVALGVAMVGAARGRRRDDERVGRRRIGEAQRHPDRTGHGQEHRHGDQREIAQLNPREPGSHGIVPRPTFPPKV
jgi:hypothetical protein